MKRSLILTGAAGCIGRVLGDRLKGYRLVLTDITDHPGPLPDNAEFRRIDLSDKEAVLTLEPVTSAILHFGGISVESAFEEILGPNIVGTHHVFELARRAGARVIFASSNHVVGFHRRDMILDENCTMRPDSFYGLSKAFGELIARLYWDKHGVESLSIRIGTCLPTPRDERHLSTWLSYDDLTALIEAALSTRRLGCRIAWGASANARRWWRDHGPSTLGYRPRDDAEIFAPLPAPSAQTDWVNAQYQGGAFCSIGYTRNEASPSDIFDWMRDD